MAQNNIRKIFSDTLVYSIGYFLNRLMPFLLLPVYTYYFSPKEYGTYSLFYVFWMFVVIFYLFGMETSFQKFFIEAKTESEKKSVFSSTIIIILLSSIVFSLLIFFFSAPIAKLITGNAGNAYFVKIISVLLVVDSLARIPMILLNSLQRSKIYTAINLVVMVINVAANLIFIIYFKGGIESVFYSYLISYVFLFLLSFAASFRYFEFKIDKAKIKTLLKFASSFLLYGLFLISMDTIDRYIIEYFKGTEQVGIYSACYRIGVVMNLLILGFRTAWTPFFLNLKDEANNKEIFAKVFSYFCYAGLFLFLTLSFFIDDLIKFKIDSISLLDEKYWSGIGIIPYILLSYLFFGLYTNLNVASYFENKIKYLIISSAIGAISNIVLNFILIPPFSIMGAAVATLASYFIMFIVLYFFSQKTFHIPYDWISILKVSIFAALLFFAKMYVSNYINMSYFSMLLVKILAVIAFFLYLYIFKFIKLPQLSAKN
jgi:O-antigen/teichoic acid export membrane protein